eukprot:713821-Amphidinium_carterae.1
MINYRLEGRRGGAPQLKSFKASGVRTSCGFDVLLCQAPTQKPAALQNGNYAPAEQHHATNAGCQHSNSEELFKDELAEMLEHGASHGRKYPHTAPRAHFLNVLLPLVR